MAFERFTKVRTRELTPMVSILTRGQISFNKASIEELKIDKFDYAVQFYDSDQKRIGIKLTNDKNEEGVIKISKPRSGQVASMSAKSLLTYYKVDFSKPQKYPLVYDKETEFLIINL